MSIKITPLQEVTGSEVEGVDLLRPLDKDVQSKLRRTLADRGVLVFRGFEFNPPQFARAMENFGELMQQNAKQYCLPDFPICGFVSNQDLDSPDGVLIVRGEQFHTDHSNYLVPPMATCLHAVSIPSSGGDTQFVNVQEAYDTLDSEVKQRLQGLRALHVRVSSRSPRKMAKLSPEAEALVPRTEQPLVLVHPENGRDSLYLNTARMECVVGMSIEDGDRLIARLMDHVTQAQYEYRHKWRKGDLVIWDNKTVLHQANGDTAPGELRYLYRLLLKGQAPLQIAA